MAGGQTGKALELSGCSVRGIPILVALTYMDAVGGWHMAGHREGVEAGHSRWPAVGSCGAWGRSERTWSPCTACPSAPELRVKLTNA